jgi:DNA topoisomerase-1
VSNWKEFAGRVLSQAWEDEGRPAEACTKCSSTILLQNSRRGLFVGCSAYPKCDYTRPWDSLPIEGVNLGVDPDTGLDILLLKGPFGYYVQLGPTTEGSKPRRAKWPPEWPAPREASPETLEKALRLLSLPRMLGLHPQTNKPVEASIGRFGPYVKHDGAFKSIPKSDSVYDIGLDRAIELLAQPKTQRGGNAGRALGLHPIDHKPVQVLDGRYGPYVNHGNVNVTIPPDMDAATVTLDDAVDLLAEKAAKELAKSGSTASPTPLAQRGHGTRGGMPGRQGGRPGGPRGGPNGPGREGQPGKRPAGQPAASASRRSRPQEAANKGNKAGNGPGAVKNPTRRGGPARPAQKTGVRRRPA